jgi:Na+-driven multidrug efflux pump
VTVVILLLTSSCIYIFKEQLVGLFFMFRAESLDEEGTSLDSVIPVVMSVIWLISFNTFPDGFKGMLKGVIKALGIQKYCIYINISGHWCINLTLQWYLGVKMGMGIKGLWVAKLILEAYIFSAYCLMIYFSDWAKISEESAKRQEREKSAMKESKAE